MSEASDSQNNLVSLTTSDPVSETSPSSEGASQPFAERLSDQLQHIIGGVSIASLLYWK